VQLDIGSQMDYVYSVSSNVKLLEARAEISDITEIRRYIICLPLVALALTRS
jgi:hypothetical protein